MQQFVANTLPPSTGLHFNPAGYKVLYEEMCKVMTEAWPDSNPESIEKHFPEYGSWF
jgi:hypothetical protein